MAERDAQLRVEQNRRIEIGDGVVVIVSARIGEAAIDISGCIFRIERDRAIEIGDGAIVVALDPIGFAAMGEKIGVFGIDLDRLIIVRDGARGLSVDQIGIGAVPEREGVVRVNDECLVVVLHCAVELTLRQIEVAAVGPSVGILGVALDRLVQIRHRAIVLAELLVSHGAVAQSEAYQIVRRLARSDDCGAGWDHKRRVRALALRHAGIGLRRNRAGKPQAAKQSNERNAQPQSSLHPEGAILIRNAARVARHKARIRAHGLNPKDALAAFRLFREDGISPSRARGAGPACPTISLTG